ncbi:hypothetical protein THRCLA_20278 [Thraustotheca clavata]|uniref:Uncharacterized protein n=1 Tax=Thraustotheca clavata TaxID=74557 RepID=A0A1W0A9Z0_9STRA|nr:hypothetical protein THRCLA_20278 [Thraustotheca clavata]
MPQGKEDKKTLCTPPSKRTPNKMPISVEPTKIKMKSSTAIGRQQCNEERIGIKDHKLSID